MNNNYVEIWLCDGCLNCDGGERHTPGCALYLNKAPYGLPVNPCLYRIVDQEAVEP